MNFCIIADYFREDLPQGGAERATDALIEHLRKKHKVSTKRSFHADPEFIKNFDGIFIVSNRQGLSDESRSALFGKKYFLVEHDFAYLKSRNPGEYEDLKAPEDQIIGRDLYDNAYKVVCQSSAQLHALKVNLGLENGVSSKGNPWSQSDLDFLRSLKDEPIRKPYAVLMHPYPTKGTASAVELCRTNAHDYEIVPQLPHREFLKRLAGFQILVFLPIIFESYSRVCAEARCLGLSLLTNQKVAFKYEEHSRLCGEELISYFEENNKKIVEIFES